MKEKIFVSNISYQKAKETFDKFSLETNYNFVPVNEQESSLAKEIKENNIRAFIADIYPYTNELYNALPKGGIIARYGVGYDSIDLQQANKAGIIICNTPGVLDNAVAEHSSWLIGSCARKIAQSHSSTLAGKWDPTQGIELRGRKVTLMGFGRISQKLAKKLSFGFEMDVSAVDIFSPKELSQRYNKSLEEIKQKTGISHYTNNRIEAFKDANFVVLVMAVLPATKHIANKEFFSQMNKSSYLINPARGALVDENALYDALVSKNIAGAALDVFEQEPYKPQNKDKNLLNLDNIIVTPHIGSNTEESNRAMATQAIKNIINILEEGKDSCPFIVN